MLRLIVLFLLIILTIADMRKDIKPVYKKAVFAGLTIMLVFRFGQGSDYFNYYYIYQSNTIFKEVGYSLLSFICRFLGLSYPMFVAVVSIICMTLLYRFMKKYTKYWFFTLLIVYCVYYITYFESALRQVLALSVMLGLVLPLYGKKKDVQMLLAILLAVSFHLSAIILFFLFIVKEGTEKDDIKFFNFLHTYKEYFVLIVIGIVTIVLLMDYKVLAQFLPEFIRTRIIYYLSNKPNMFAIINRAIFVIAAYYLALGPREKIGKNNILLLKIYLLGFAVYCLLSKVDIVASRINVYFRIVEIVLLPNLVYYNWNDMFLKQRKQIASCLTVIIICLGLLYAKECYNAMYQSDYKTPSYYNYPYISVLNPKDLLTHRLPDKFGYAIKYTS